MASISLGLLSPEVLGGRPVAADGCLGGIRNRGGGPERDALSEETGLEAVNTSVSSRERLPHHVGQTLSSVNPLASEQQFGHCVKRCRKRNMHHAFLAGDPDGFEQSGDCGLTRVGGRRERDHGAEALFEA